jgi:hypothetical protein
MMLGMGLEWEVVRGWGLDLGGDRLVDSFHRQCFSGEND